VGDGSSISVADTVRELIERAHRLEPERVPALVAEVAGGAGIRDVELFLVDRQQVHLTSLRSGERHTVDGTLLGDAYRRGRGHTVDDGGGAKHVYVPLVDGEDRLGVLSAVVVDPSEERVDDVHVLAAAAAGLIVSKRAYTDAYERSRRVQEMDLAAELRWALLPPLTLTTPRVQIAGMLEPAYEIAGDAFDYSINGDRVHVALFDAVGHGLRACQLATVAIATYRNARRSGNDITQTANAIDDAIREQFGESWFVTAFLGELDLVRGTFRWSSAGHPQPVLVRGGRVVATLASTPGLPLGLGGAAPPINEHHLEPDDVVFAYSDGVTEARNDLGEFFGETRLADHLARAAADELAGAETVRRLVLRLYEHRPAPLRDDATMLMVGWRRPAATDGDAG